ncbi:MAG: hypothetical protein GTO12_07180 [Proteobacteria bacterium]|nr:hypothetical protein [Pseudomonadota bacterium]
MNTASVVTPSQKMSVGKPGLSLVRNANRNYMKIQNIINGMLFLVLCLFHFNVMAEAPTKTVISQVSLDEFSYGTIYGSAGFVVTSSTGTTIVTDPYNVVEGVKPDIITASHSHFDHNDRILYNKINNCKISLYKVETFTVKDIYVHGIAASHSPDSINQEMPSNVIYTFEVDGLRIAHMGDIGQEGLTKEQLKELGDLDLVFMHFVDAPQFGMTIVRSLKILNQINPKIVIPTHLDKEGFEQLHKIFNRIEYQTVRWAVDRNYLDNLGDDRIVVFLMPKHGSIIEQWKKTLMSN